VAPYGARVDIEPGRDLSGSQGRAGASSARNGDSGPADPVPAPATGRSTVRERAPLWLAMGFLGLGMVVGASLALDAARGVENLPVSRFLLGLGYTVLGLFWVGVYSLRKKDRSR